ncbi:MAG TPA: WG repeat-containing protein, partial [Oculatellaceae cyanobacterium]
GKPCTLIKPGSVPPEDSALEAYPVRYSEDLAVYRELSTLEKDKVDFNITRDALGNKRKFYQSGNGLPCFIYGYKNKNGEVVIPARFYEASDFHDGIALVRLTPLTYKEPWKQAFINKSGEVVSPEFAKAHAFESGRALVVQRLDKSIESPDFKIYGGGNLGRWGLINQSFEYVIKPDYFQLNKVGNDFFVGRPLSKGPVQVLNRDGKEVLSLPEAYNSLRAIGDDRFLMTNSQWSADMAPAVIVDSRGAVVHEFPKNATLKMETEDGFIFTTGTNNPTKDRDSGFDLLFMSKTGELRKTVRCNFLNEHTWFESGVAVVGINGQVPEPVGALGWLDKYVPYGDKGIMDTQGNWLIAPSLAAYKVAEPDRFIKTVIVQSHFDSEQCKTVEGGLASQFELLKKQYRLIGMSKTQLVDLIGTPDSADELSGERDIISYELGRRDAGCANAHAYLQFKLKDGKILAWKIDNFGRPREWNYTD